MGDKVASKEERTKAPLGWIWEDDWTIDTNRAVDEQGLNRRRSYEFDPAESTKALNIVSIKRSPVGVQWKSSSI